LLQRDSHTVAKKFNYPKQDLAIHIVEGKESSPETTEGKPNQANQDNNRSFPEYFGQGGSLSAATATPSLRQCMTQA
jgi:hypothetical protein